MDRIRLGVAAALIAVAPLAALEGPGGSAAAANATASATKTVQIKGFAFKPATARVERGTRVVFANSSGSTHTATGDGFDTKRIAPGKSAAVRFSKAGIFAYHCKIHSFMKGKVVVE
ncbi:MAG TPA: cupredoxin domain-containing protein [Solirubrobacterales bacterium]|nr:cupredoxin domain-containing protein [Solirubrobacterales bacterium]